MYKKKKQNFTYIYPKELILNWSRENHARFSEEFRRRAFILLCVQKRYRYIDKNIFFLIINKMSKNNFEVINFNTYPLYELLHFMKRDDVNIYKDICKKASLKGVIAGTYNGEAPTIQIEDEELGIIKVGEPKRFMTFYVKKDGQVQELSLILDLSFSKTDLNPVMNHIRFLISEKDKQVSNSHKGFALCSTIYAFFFSILYFFV